MAQYMNRMNMPDSRVLQFHTGQVWVTSRGCLWRVERIEGGNAVLRRGFHGTGRINRKGVYDVGRWRLFYDPEYDDVVPKWHR